MPEYPYLTGQNRKSEFIMRKKVGGRNVDPDEI